MHRRESSSMVVIPEESWWFENLQDYATTILNCLLKNVLTQ